MKWGGARPAQIVLEVNVGFCNAHTPPKDLHKLSELKSRREANLFSCPTLCLHNLRGCVVRWRPPSTLLYRNLLVPLLHPLFSNVTI